MVLEASPEPVLSRNAGISLDVQVIANNHTDDQCTNTYQRHTTPADNSQVDAADTVKEFWCSKSWWQRGVSAVKFIPTFFVAFGLYMLMMLIASANSEKERDRLRARRSRPSSTDSELPGPTNTVSSQTSSAPRITLSLDEPKTGPQKYCRGLISFINTRSTILAHCCTAIIIFFIGQFGALTRQDQESCIARQAESGFTGNADLYGLGVRLGIYVQWITATIAIRYVPSGRSFVVSSYLFYQFGMIVAMCLLLSPKYCTFTAEVAIVLQFLWAGNAIVMVPTQAAGNRYDRNSKCFGIEILSSVMSCFTFLFTIWFHIRLCLGKYDFAETPDGTMAFWIGPVDLKYDSRTRQIQAVWIGFYVVELIGIFGDQDSAYHFTGFLDWNWRASAALATGSLASVLKVFVLVIISSLTVLGNMVRLEENREDEEDWGTFVTVIRHILRFSRKCVLGW